VANSPALRDGTGEGRNRTPERIKELNCLYGIARLAECCHDSMNDFLKYLVDFLPLSWQYPEIACARIIFEDRTYRSKNFKLARWRLLSRILVYNEPVGEVAVFYSEERPAADEGPFLKEERILIEKFPGGFRVPLPFGLLGKKIDRNTTGS